MTSTQDLLNQAGVKSLSWKNAPYGATITAPILSADVVQARNFDTGELESWDDGNPKLQFRIVIQTEQRESAEDNGERALYVKGFGEQLKALKAAIQQGGAKDLQRGGVITMTFLREDPLPPGKRGNPTKVYTFVYQPPSPTANLLGQAPQDAPAAPPSQPQQAGGWQTPAAAPAPGFAQPPAQPAAQPPANGGWQQQAPQAQLPIPDAAPPAAPPQQPAAQTAAAATPPGLTPEQLAAFQAWQTNGQQAAQPA